MFFISTNLQHLTVLRLSFMGSFYRNNFLLIFYFHDILFSHIILVTSIIDINWFEKMAYCDKLTERNLFTKNVQNVVLVSYFPLEMIEKVSMIYILKLRFVLSKYFYYLIINNKLYCKNLNNINWLKNY